MHNSFRLEMRFPATLTFRCKDEWRGKVSIPHFVKIPEHIIA
jgi:hypothetical protein